MVSSSLIINLLSHVKYHTEHFSHHELLVVPGDKEGAGILFFHGYGADAFDLLSLSQITKDHSPAPTWYFPQGTLPLSFGEGYTGRAWFPLNFALLQNATGHEVLDEVFPKELQKVRTDKEALIASLPLPPERLFLGGFSQGAVLATDIVLHSRAPFKGLAILSGTLLYASAWQASAPLAVGTPFFQSHGMYDPLLPLSKARALERLLQEAGLQGELHTFAGGHEIPPEIISGLNTFLT